MIEIGTAKEEDIEGITELEAETFVDPWHYASVESVVGRDHITTLVAKEKEQVVGYVIYYHIINEGEIARVAVKESFHRQKIGTMLLSEMIARGETEGLSEYSLEVRESNEPAIGLYHSFSFKTEGRHKKYYHSPDEDALVMWRRSNETEE